MKAEDFFGTEAAEHWLLAWDHLHKFAHRTGCLPGGDVIKHFEAERNRYQQAIDLEIRERGRQAKSGEST